MFGKRTYAYDLESYLRHQKRTRNIMIVIFAIFIVFAIVSMAINQYGMSLSKIFGIILNRINGVPIEDYRTYIEDYIVFEMYIPRMVACVTVGVILAVGGAIMQSVIRNPLADSYTTGISSGALLGVSVYMVLDISIVPISGDTGLIVNAFIFSLIPCALIIGLSSFRKLTSNMIVFIGMAVMFLFSAIVTFLNYVASPEDLEEMYEWSLGSLNMIGSSSTPYLIVAAVVMFVLAMLIAERINVISVGDKFATSVGVNNAKIRALALVFVSVFTSLAVCFVGTIGFIGLVVPNIARMFVGSNNSILIPVSALLGAIVLMAADCVARMAAVGGLPVGLITSVIGGPMMLFILVKQKEDAWGDSGGR